MTLVWFRPTRFRDMSVERIRETLAPAGVIERPSTSQGVYYFVDQAEPDVLLKAIGDVIVRPHRGRIEVWPYVGASERDLRSLYGTADLAFSSTPTKADGWEFRRRPEGKSYWRTTINVPLDDNDTWHHLIARERADEWDRRVRANTAQTDLEVDSVR